MPLEKIRKKVVKLLGWLRRWHIPEPPELLLASSKVVKLLMASNGMIGLFWFDEFACEDCLTGVVALTGTGRFLVFEWYLISVIWKVAEHYRSRLSICTHYVAALVTLSNWELEVYRIPRTFLIVWTQNFSYIPKQLWIYEGNTRADILQ